MDINKKEVFEKEINKTKILKSNLRIENESNNEEITKLEKKIKEQYVPKISNNYSCDIERNVNNMKQRNKKNDRKRIETEENITNGFLLQTKKDICNNKNKMNLNERKENYLSKRFEDRLFELEGKSKSNNEEQKEYYTEDILEGNYNINKHKKGEYHYIKNIKNSGSQKIKKAKTATNIKKFKSQNSEVNEPKYYNSQNKFLNSNIKHKKQFKQVTINNVSLQSVSNFNENTRRYPSCSFQSPSIINNNYYHYADSDDIHHSSKAIFHSNPNTTNYQTKTFSNILKQEFNNNHEYLMDIRKHLKDYYDNKSKHQNQSLPKSSKIIITNDKSNNKINKSFTSGIFQANSKSNQKLRVDNSQQIPNYVVHNSEEQKINKLNNFIKQIPQATIPFSSLTTNKPLPKYHYQANLKYQYSLNKSNLIPKEFNYTRLNKNNNTNNCQTDLSKNYSFGIEQFAINNNLNQLNQHKYNVYNFNEDVFNRYTKSPNVILNKPTNQISCLNISNNLGNNNSNYNTNSNLDYLTSIKPTNNRLQDLEQMRNFNFNLKQNPNTTNCLPIHLNNNNVIINKKNPVNYSNPVALSKTANNTLQDKIPQPQIYGKKIPQGQITSYNSNNASASNLSSHSNVTTNENKHFNYFDYYQNNSYISPQQQNTNGNYVYQKVVKTEESVNNINANREDEQIDENLNEKRKNIFFEKIVRFEPSMKGSDYKSYSYGEYK